MSPDQLPQNHRDEAYAHDDPAVKMVLAGFQSLSAHIPLRSNSALLQKEKQSGRNADMTEPLTL